ncbi:hypothetical protein PK98_13700 [Croceibacterium mercuriale]|uniref:Uncharacterized protein n=1 Tax=Croceibacterium mercuriale TaxID=1572751 RepID=A0A0B2BYZ4_9SPHN|nr:hypothetical protein [Croceibacterium mercuriale]KHL24916.1 hypothetical protein PK98_13700 [Croceibacterium mercuriale]
MAGHEAERAQRREAWLGSVLLFGFGCSVLGFVAAKDRLPWLSADRVRNTLTHAVAEVSHDLARPFGDALAR